MPATLELTRRFVILCHEPPDSGGRPRHWDLMLETEAGLLTWALDEEPALGRAIQAEALPRHRSVYLDYEGPISQGRGSVRRWDHGVYRICEQHPDRRVLKIWGNHLGPAEVTLVREQKADGYWTVRFSSDG